MEEENLICLNCKHYEKPNGYGCRAFPEGIPYSFPPNNKHDKPLEGQEGDYIYTPVNEKKK